MGRIIAERLKRLMQACGARTLHSDTEDARRDRLDLDRLIAEVSEDSPAADIAIVDDRIVCLRGHCHDFVILELARFWVLFEAYIGAMRNGIEKDGRDRPLLAVQTIKACEQIAIFRPPHRIDFVIAAGLHECLRADGEAPIEATR